MDDQDSYLNEEEVNQQLNNVGNKVNQFGQGMVNGVKSGINDYKSIKNNGLQSSNKDLDNNDKKTEIPDPKTNNNQVGVTNPVTESNNNSLSDKDNNLNDKNKDSKTKEKDKEKKDINEQSKKSSLKEKINEHNPLTKLKEKVDEHNPLKKLNKKIEEKLNPAKVMFSKIKIVGLLIILGILVLFLIIVFMFGGVAINISLHYITEDFIPSMEEITNSNNWKVVDTFGWNLKLTGEYETIEVTETTFVNTTSPTGAIIKVPIIQTVTKEYPIYEAVFNNGIDINIPKGSIIYAVHPGTVTKITEDYIEINHNLNDENDYDKTEYVTRYYNYGKLFDDIKEDSLVARQTELSISDGETLHFEIYQEGEEKDSNLFFGYEEAKGVCGEKKEMDKYTGSIKNDIIKELVDANCSTPTENIGIDNGRKKLREVSDYGIPEGTYTSLVCGSTNLKATGPSRAQCAAGVYRYFQSFLPSLDNTAWTKFDRIRGNAVDYWINNNALGKNGFKADSNPTPGSVWVSSYSRTMCGGSPCGHVMAVISVEGENVKVFECNHFGNEVCWYNTYTKSYLSSYTGFLGYIHILGDC